MSIRYLSEYKLFKIDTVNTTYILSITDTEGFIGHVYYGKLISDDDVNYLLRTSYNKWLPSQLPSERNNFMDMFPFEFAGSNTGDFRESSIEIEDINGNRSVNFTYDRYEIIKEGFNRNHEDLMPSLYNKSETLVIFASDKVLGLNLKLYYSIFDKEDAIVRRSELINNSNNSIYLTKLLSMNIDMDNDDYDMITLHGNWGRERKIERYKINPGKHLVSSIRGRSSHQENPFTAIVQKNADQTQGDAYGFNLVYSGNFMSQIEVTQFGDLRFCMGINPKNFKFLLETNETFISPEAVLVYSPNGIGGMSRVFHNLYRNHLIAPNFAYTKRPLLINNWEATYFDFDDEKIISIAKKAKEIGLDMLVLDDGWFGTRSDPNTSLGDWFVNESKLKGGLTSLVAKINEIGLDFGLWFEPEMVSPVSMLNSMHPDWAIKISDREPCLARNQMVLDLSNPEVREYIFDSIATILRSCNIKYIKWDMNRQLTDLSSSFLPKERMGELSHRYVLGVYEIQGKLLKEFPYLFIENCSSGGARFDPAMLYYSPQIWTSDDTEAIERLSIQEGTAICYPLSSISCHIAASPNHVVRRETPMNTRARVASFGVLGCELDITQLSSDDINLLKAELEDYNSISDLILKGDYYRISSFNDNNTHDSWMIVSKDKREAVFTFVQVVARHNNREFRIRLNGLDPNCLYRIESELFSESMTLHGNVLMNAGIIIPYAGKDYVAYQFKIKAV